MLERYDLKRLSGEELGKFEATFIEEKALAERRLAAPKRKQAAKPDFSNFNPLADERISIDIYIEEWEAVRDELTEQLALIARDHDRRQGLNQTIRML